MSWYHVPAWGEQKVLMDCLPSLPNTSCVGHWPACSNKVEKNAVQQHVLHLVDDSALFPSEVNRQLKKEGGPFCGWVNQNLGNPFTKKCMGMGLAFNESQPPFSCGCGILCQATSGVFHLLSTWSKPQRKSLKSQLICFRVFSKADMYIIWYVVMLCRTCWVRKTFSMDVRRRLAQPEILLLILSKQKMYMLGCFSCCPKGAARYFCTSPKILMVQPVS